MLGLRDRAVYPSVTPRGEVLDGRGKETPRRRTASREIQMHRLGAQRRELRLFPGRCEEFGCDVRFATGNRSCIRQLESQ